MNDNHDQIEPSMQTAGPGADWRTTWTPSRRRFLTLTGLALGGAALGLGVSACGTAQTGSSAGQARRDVPARPGRRCSWPASNGARRRASTRWRLSPDWPTNVQRATNRSSSMKPCCASTSWTARSPRVLPRSCSSPTTSTFVLPLQDGTKWSDGSDLTADDVVFTFELGKTAPVTFATVWQYIDSVKATDPRTVEFKLKSKPYNPIIVKNFIASVAIVPKAVFGSISPDKIPSETNLKPIGSGPFLLDKYDQTQVNLKRNDNYWGKTAFGTPPMTTINHPIFKSNNDGDLKLESGEIDVSQQFTAQIWKMWEAGKPVSTWMKKKPYHVPGNIPFLIFNLNKPGLDNPKVRLAIAYGIDYANIATTAMSDYSEPANASLIIPTGYESKFYDAAAVEAEGWKFDPAKAVEILENELKAKKGSDGIYELPDGTKLGGWKLITPTGWTDWNTACEIVAKSVKEVGIGISTEFPQAPTAISRWQNGDFDLCMNSYTGVNPASPWIRFRDAWMTEAYRIPASLRSGTTTGSRTPRSRPMSTPPPVRSPMPRPRRRTPLSTRSIARTCRSVPLMYRPLEFYEFNASNWENFPTEENPYAPPMWQGAGIQWLFKIKKVGT